MNIVGLIWKAVLALVGVGAILAALFVLVILVIVAAKTIKKEVQNDGSKNMP